jgi:EAL domain-containing protein (putative c-di-GMP-specific phosphodiesterase class I)
MRYVAHPDGLARGADSAPREGSPPRPATGRIPSIPLDVLDAALNSGQIRAHYQPQVRLADRTVVGFEALVRWEHPGQGVLAPGRFLPEVQRHGMWGRLTLAVFEDAVRQVERWGRLGLNLRASVNITPSVLADGRTFAEIVDLAVSKPEAARRITLEITEAASDLSCELLRDLLAKLHADGFALSREGVERPETARVLHDTNCPLAQGFLFGGVLRPDEIPAWLSEQEIAHAAAA